MSVAAGLFQDFLSASHGNVVRGMTDGIDYAYRYTPNTNTGVASGFDLNNDGWWVATTPSVSAVSPGSWFHHLLRFEIVGVRSFQNFRWKDMPGNLTNDPTASCRISTAPMRSMRFACPQEPWTWSATREVHFLTAHPTPPTFDGAEDRNGKRNHDEIRFWSDYVSGGATAATSTTTRAAAAACSGCEVRHRRRLQRRPAGWRRLRRSDRPTARQSAGEFAMTLASAGGGRHRPGSEQEAPISRSAAIPPTTPPTSRIGAGQPSGGLRCLRRHGDQRFGVFWPTDEVQGDSNDTGALFDLVGTSATRTSTPDFPSSDHKAVWVDVQVAAVPDGSWAMTLADSGPEWDRWCAVAATAHRSSPAGGAGEWLRPVDFIVERGVVGCSRQRAVGVAGFRFC